MYGAMQYISNIDLWAAVHMFGPKAGLLEACLLDLLLSWVLGNDNDGIRFSLERLDLP
jgi:hypothetical protein